MIKWKDFIEFELSEAPAQHALDRLREAVPDIVDEDYRSFIEAYDGGEGFLGEGFLALDSVDELLATLPRAREYGAGLLPFGGDGSDGLFVFDTIGSNWSVLRLPLTSSSPEDVRQVASGFRDFIEKLTRGEII
jgi:hypothetical protein